MQGQNGGLHHFAYWLDDWDHVRDAADVLAYNGIQLDGPTAMAALQKGQPGIGFDRLIFDEHIGKVSVVGAGMRSHPGVSATFFEALAALPIHDPPAARVRDRMIDLAMAGHDLDRAALATILTSDDMAAPWRDVSKGGEIGFSFTKTDRDPDSARRDLGLAVEALCARIDLDLAFADAQPGIFANRNAGDPTKWTYQPDFSRQGRIDQRRNIFALRLTAQLSPKNKLMVFWDEQPYCSGAAWPGTTDEGCNCVDGRTQSCGSGTGECRQGTQTCAGGQWGACMGGTLPATEICNGRDDDCDVLIDESSVCSGCDLVRYGSRPSLFCGTRVTFGDAERSCRAFGYALVSIEDAAENQFLVDRLRDFLASTSDMWGSSEDAWIGLQDRDADGDYAWASGSVGEYRLWRGEVEPGPGLCLSLDDAEMYADWFARACDSLKGYVCEAR